MSALSAASDVKEEEGGGCYENCSMLKQSDGDTTPPHTSVTPSFSFFSLSLVQTLTIIRSCTQGHWGSNPDVHSERADWLGKALHHTQDIVTPA